MKNRVLVLFLLILSFQVRASFEVTYIADYFSVVNGGIKSGSSYLDNLSVNYTKDRFLSSNGTLGIHFIYNNNTEFSQTYVGDAQVLSNIDNANMQEFFEIWYQWKSSPNTLTTIGFVDLNSIYDVIDTASLFINSAHGIGTEFSLSGENGPSIFPSASLAFNVETQLHDNLTLNVGFFDAIPGSEEKPTRPSFELSDGLLFVTELGLVRDKTKYLIGAWYYTQSTESITGSLQHNKGGYVSADTQAQWLGKAFSWWFRLGVNKRELNQFSTYVGGGVVIPALFLSRPNDSFGFAIARAHLSDTFKNFQQSSVNPLSAAETSIEITYQIPLNKTITIQPDIQYIINPSASSTLNDTLVAGIRFALTF